MTLLPPLAPAEKIPADNLFLSGVIFPEIPFFCKRSPIASCPKKWPHLNESRIVNPHQKRIGIVGCKHTTLELIDALSRAHYTPDQIITISPEEGASRSVAGYLNLAPLMKERGIRTYTARAFSLKTTEDRDAILRLNLDIVFVIGWQRLIPEWFLDALPLGAFGMHGSSRRLPHGRGRSPLNWSLIQNKTTFFTHLFKFEATADSGKIAGVQAFPITPFDTCLTLHHKNTLAMIRLVLQALPELLAGTGKLEGQGAEGASYYPKRTAEDGAIFWEDSASDIYNLIRAVTRPFPGAFTFLNNDAGRKITIWRAIPFGIDYEGPPGGVLHVFNTGEFLVKTGDSTLLVQEADGARFTAAEIGAVCGNLGRPRKMWENVPL
jgi:methionyl-tRNA formyltransferase